MKSKELFEAIGYIDERYLDMIDAPETEMYSMKDNHKRLLSRRTLSIMLAAVICISLLTVTATAAGWIPGLFNFLKSRFPQDKELFEAAAQANENAVPEVKESPHLDLSKFTLLEQYFDGNTILIGYNFDIILPEPTIGFEPDAELLAKNRYYHDNVQANKDNIIDALLADGKNFAVISEYGHKMLPVTSDNDRMSDGMIGTYSTSFGATCADVDGVFAEDYVQAKECVCGKNHISPDRQIDASTCKYADVTWFAKNLKHKDDDKYFADLIDLVTYSKEQITVHTYSDLPQYMINLDETCLVPLTAENAGEIIPFDGKTSIISFLENLLK